MSGWDFRPGDDLASQFAIQHIDVDPRQYGFALILRDTQYDLPHAAGLSFSLRSSTTEQAIADGDWLRAELDALAERARQRDDNTSKGNP